MQFPRECERGKRRQCWGIKAGLPRRCFGEDLFCRSLAKMYGLTNLWYRTIPCWCEYNARGGLGHLHTLMHFNKSHLFQFLSLIRNFWPNIWDINRTQMWEFSFGSVSVCCSQKAKVVDVPAVEQHILLKIATFKLFECCCWVFWRVLYDVRAVWFDFRLGKFARITFHLNGKCLTDARVWKTRVLFFCIVTIKRTTYSWRLATEMRINKINTFHWDGDTMTKWCNLLPYLEKKYKDCLLHYKIMGFTF